MNEKHPILSSLSSIGTNLAVFGFFAFYLLESHLAGLSFGKLALSLVLLQLFDSMVLRRSIRIRQYILYNLPIAALILALSRYFPVFDSPGLTQYFLFYLALVTLLLYRIIRACRPAAESALVFSADSLVVLLIIARIWNQLAPFPSYGSLEGVLLAALFLCFLHLSLRRLSFAPASPNAPHVGSWLTAGFFLFSAGIIGAFCLLVSGFFTSAATFAITGSQYLFSLLSRLASAILRFLEYLISLLPDAPAGTLPEENMQPDLEAMMEQGSSSVNGYAFLAVVITAAALALLYCLAKLWRCTLNLSAAKTPALQKERRSFYLVQWLRHAFKALRRMFSNFWILIFRPDTIPALLLRAKWYGKRKGCPKKPGETVSEYLSRLMPNLSCNTEKNPACLLSGYANQYLYGQEPPSVPREELEVIKTAFSFF